MNLKFQKGKENLGLICLKVFQFALELIQKKYTPETLLFLQETILDELIPFLVANKEDISLGFSKVCLGLLCYSISVRSRVVSYILWTLWIELPPFGKGEER